MIEGVTRSGFAFAVDELVADNMELVDALADSSDENPLAISTVCKLLLGADQRKRLYEHLRTEDGRVPLSDVSDALVDVLNSFGNTGKN
ncbi:MAG: hypothetical protein LUE22_00885 [Oscillospiraceae bacterium]|nr:hypothetical protein [Oscillospiraceae bacterium]